MNKTTLNARHTKAFYETVSIPLQRTVLIFGKHIYFFSGVYADDYIA